MVSYVQPKSPTLEEDEWQRIPEVRMAQRKDPIPIPQMQSLSADDSLMDAMYDVSARLGLPRNAVKLALATPKATDKVIADIMDN